MTRPSIKVFFFEEYFDGSKIQVLLKGVIWEKQESKQML